MGHFILVQSYCTHAILSHLNLKNQSLGLPCCYGSHELLLTDPVRHILETAVTSSFPAFPSITSTLNLRQKYANGNFFLQLKVYPRHVSAINVIVTTWANNADNNN